MKNVREAAIHYLSFRDRTTSEVRKYLEGKEFPSEEIDETIEAFLDCSLLSDEKYCGNYIRYSIEKGRGPLRIEKELREKGIDIEEIRRELELQFSERGEKELAMECAQKLFEKIGECNDKELSRIARRLATQGFRSTVIFEVLGKLKREFTQRI
ncbi:MAG: RecX family transcriptional regulator [Eubacteriales bacterium]|nr:RecX family transcriptional regulator [Eubacteriales bacterium]